MFVLILTYFRFLQFTISVSIRVKLFSSHQFVRQNRHILYVSMPKSNGKSLKKNRGYKKELTRLDQVAYLLDIFIGEVFDGKWGTLSRDRCCLN